MLIADDLEPPQQLKTLLHEWAHVTLGHENRAGLARDVREVEAESVAFLLGQTIGLDTEVYSVPYIAGWAGGDLDLVAATAQQVLTTTKQLVDTLQRDVGVKLVHDPLDHALPETETNVVELAPSTTASEPDMADRTSLGEQPALADQPAMFERDSPEQGSALDAADSSDAEFLRALGHELEAEQATEFADVIYRADGTNRAAEILAESGRTALQTGRIMQRFGIPDHRIRDALDHDVTATDRATGPLYPRSEVDPALAVIAPDLTTERDVAVETLRGEKTQDMKMLQRVVRTAPDARLVVELAEALELESVNAIRVCESVEAQPGLAVAVAVGLHDGDGAAALDTLKRAWPDIDGGWESHAHPSMLTTQRAHLTVVPDPPAAPDPILEMFAEWDAMDPAPTDPTPQPSSP